MPAIEPRRAIAEWRNHIFRAAGLQSAHESRGGLEARVPMSMIKTRSGFAKDSGALRDALGSESEKPSSHNVLGMARKIPERFATLAKRSERIEQVLASTDSSPAFGSDSRDGRFFC